MAKTSCPQGHPSRSSDYCDVCGAAMTATGRGGAAAGRAVAEGGAGATAAPRAADQTNRCPSCKVQAMPNALFCEACGYDFTTGAMPRGAAEPLDLGPESGAGPSTEQPTSQATAAEPSERSEEPEGPGAEPTDSSPAQGIPTPPVAEPVTPSPVSWVVEQWIDPEWYALQQSPDPMPSPGIPKVVAIRSDEVLIGRPSRSRGIDPDIDCEPDTGISRRHALLSTDGQRWFVEDLDSANGTYVCEAAAPLPTEPLVPGRRHELHGGERIFVGAWTRLVLRMATDGEQDIAAG